MVSTMRITTAAPLPQATARACCSAGNPRAASAITTALSPDSTMLTPMICSSAIQNSGLVKLIDILLSLRRTGSSFLQCNVALLADRRHQHDHHRDDREAQHRGADRARNEHQRITVRDDERSAQVLFHQWAENESEQHRRRLAIELGEDVARESKQRHQMNVESRCCSG